MTDKDRKMFEHFKNFILLVVFIGLLVGYADYSMQKGNEDLIAQKTAPVTDGP
jgi:hypothetical protein